MPQSACFIDGRSVPLAEAVRTAADVIGASRLPIFLVGHCDVAGLRAAITLAERVGGVIDHSESEIALRELDVMRGFGKFIVTPGEARQRGDTVLLVGSGLTKIWPDMVEVLGLAEVPRLALQPERRQIFWAGADGEEESLASLANHTIRAGSETLPGLIAALRASNAGRHVALAVSDKNALDALAEGLRRARFGVVVYSPSLLDAPAIEMLMGLVADLNRTTRFSTLSVGGSGNAETLMQTSGWMTGFPPRTGFGRNHPEHDPWRFEARRLIESGEADALVWISGEPNLSAWTSRIPVIALRAEQSDTNDVKVQITIGQHGYDHDSVEFIRETQSLGFRRATHASSLPSAATILDGIAASLPREAV